MPVSEVTFAAVIYRTVSQRLLLNQQMLLILNTLPFVRFPHRKCIGHYAPVRLSQKVIGHYAPVRLSQKVYWPLCPCQTVTEGVLAIMPLSDCHRKCFGHCAPVRLSQKVIGHYAPVRLSQKVYWPLCPCQTVTEGVLAIMPLSDCHRKCIGHYAPVRLSQKVIGHYAPVRLSQKVIGHYALSDCHRMWIGHCAPVRLSQKMYWPLYPCHSETSTHPPQEPTTGETIPGWRRFDFTLNCSSGYISLLLHKLRKLSSHLHRLGHLGNVNGD